MTVELLVAPRLWEKKVYKDSMVQKSLSAVFLVLEIQSRTEPGGHWLARLLGQETPVVCLYSLELKEYATTLSFLCGN